MTWWIWFLSSRQWKQILDGFDSYLLDSKSKSLKRWVWEFRKDLPVVIDTSCINGKTDADPCIDLEDPMRLWVVSWVSDGKAWLDNSVGTWIKNGKARIWYIYTTIRQQMISWTRRVVKECQAQPPSLFFRVGGGENLWLQESWGKEASESIHWQDWCFHAQRCKWQMNSPVTD